MGYRRVCLPEIKGSRFHVRKISLEEMLVWKIKSPYILIQITVCKKSLRRFTNRVWTKTQFPNNGLPSKIQETRSRDMYTWFLLKIKGSYHGSISVAIWLNFRICQIWNNNGSKGSRLEEYMAWDKIPRIGEAKNPGPSAKGDDDMDARR